MAKKKFLRTTKEAKKVWQKKATEAAIIAGTSIVAAYGVNAVGGKIPEGFRKFTGGIIAVGGVATKIFVNHEYADAVGNALVSIGAMQAALDMAPGSFGSKVRLTSLVNHTEKTDGLGDKSDKKYWDKVAKQIDKMQGSDDDEFEGLEGDDDEFEGLEGDDDEIEGLEGDDDEIEGLEGDDDEIEGLEGDDDEIEGVDDEIEGLEGDESYVEKMY